MPSSAVSEIQAQKTPQAALGSVVDYMFDNECNHWREAGQPANHVFYDLLALRKANIEAEQRPALKLTPAEYGSLGKVLEQLYADEHRHWLEAGKPTQHIFVDVRTLGREMIRHKEQVKRVATPERESDTSSAALRGQLAPVNAVEAPQVPSRGLRSMATPGLGD